MTRGVYRGVGKIIFALISLSIGTLGQNPNIRGEVRDPMGNKIEGAKVSLYWQCRNCPDALYPATESDESGYFLFYSREKRASIFLDDRVPEGAWAPLSYLTPEKRRKIHLLKSQTVKKLPGGGVQTFILQYRYAVAKLNFAPCGTIKRKTVYDLRIFDGNNHLLDYGAIPDSAYREGGSVVHVALPAGFPTTRWYLEVRDRSQHRSIIFAKQQLIARPGAEEEIQCTP